MFLHPFLHRLGISSICKSIGTRSKYKFDLEEIVSKLVYGRILFPDSKLSTWHLSHNFIEQPSFELEDVYRALSVLARESDYIQAQLYRNSMASKPRDTLRSIKMLYHEAYGYQPAFDRTDFTDELQDNAGILIDTEIVSKPMMRKILKKIKKS